MSTFEITAPDGRTLEVIGDTMPTEQEIDDIFKATGTDSPMMMTQSVMDNEDGKIYNVPIAMDGIDAKFGIETQHKGADKGSFFGKVKTFADWLPVAAVPTVGNIANFADSAYSASKEIVQNVQESGIAGATMKAGERIEHSIQSMERGAILHLGEASDTAIAKSYHYQDKVALLQAAERGDFSRWGDNLSEEDKAQILEERRQKVKWVDDLRAKNKSFWRKGAEILRSETQMDDIDKIMEGIGGAAISVTEAAGVTMATKSPTAAAALIGTLYGAMANTQYFDKAIETGMDAEDAMDKALVAGIIEGGVEFVGDKVLMGISKIAPIARIRNRVLSSAIIKAMQNKVGKEAVKKIGTHHANSVFGAAVKGFASEGTEEAVQTALGMGWENYTGVEDYTDDEILGETMFSLVVGGIPGAGVATIGSSVHNRLSRQTNERIKAVLQEQTPELTEQELQTTADAVQEMLFQESGNYINEMNKIIEKELQPDTMPEGLTAESLAAETRKLLKEKYQMSDEDIEKTIKASLGMIDARNQFNAAYATFYEGLANAGQNAFYADAESRILAARAVTIARAEGTSVDKVLERWNLQFRQEAYNPDKHGKPTVKEQAMYKSKLPDFGSFYDDISKNENTKDRYFTEDINGIGLDIPRNAIRHDANKHGLTKEEWLGIFDAVRNGGIKEADLGDKVVMNGTPVKMVVDVDGVDYGVVFERMKNGRNLVQTAFKLDNKNWMKKRTPGWSPFTHDLTVVSPGRSMSDIISVLDENVNRPLYQGEEAPRGGFVREGENSIIYLFENADPSTVIHELGHFFLEDMRRFGDNETTKEQLQAVYNYVGSKDGNLTTEQHEYFADSFEVYLLDGRAPNTLLGKVFARFKKWIGRIWSEVKRLNGINLTEDMRKTFDEMLGGRSLDFAMQVSGLRMAESLNGNNIPPAVVNKAVRLLDEGKMSRADMDNLVEQLKTGELKAKEVNQYLQKFEAAGKARFADEKKTQADFDRFMKKMSAGNESVKKAMYLLKVGKMSKADMSELIGWLKAGKLNYFDFSNHLKQFENSNQIHSEVVTEGDRTYYKRQLESGIIDYPSAMRAINMLKEGKISKDILNNVLERIESGEISPRKLYSEIAEYDVVNKINHEALNPFDKVKYKSLLERGNVKKTDIIDKINRLLKWTEPRKQGGKIVGRFPNLQMNKQFEHIRELIAMDKDTAREKIAENVKLINAMIEGKETGDMDTLVFDNKILSIPAKRADASLLVEVYNAISDSYNAGRLTTAITAEAKRKRKARMINETINVLTNDGRVDWRQERGKLKQFVNQLGTSQMSWNGLLDILSMNDKSSRTGQSLLNQNLDVFEAEQTEALGVADDGEKASRMIEKGLAGADNAGISLSRYVNEELQKKSVIEWGKNKKTFTKDELLDIWMKAQDQETRQMMADDNILQYNDAFLAEVNEVLTAQDRAVGNALFEFYDDNYQKINAFYEDKFGTSLGKRPFYSPRSMERGGINVDTGDMSSYAGFSGVKQRTAKAGALKIKGAFKVLQDYIVNSNHWIAWSDKLIDINAVMGDVQVKEIIRNLFGKKMEDRLSYEVSRMASNDKMHKGWFASEALSKIRSRYAVSVLAAKPALMIKQWTSFPAYWEHMSTADFMDGLADFAVNMKEAVDTLGNTTLMKTRDVNIIKDFAELSKLEMFKKNTGKVKLREFMMSFIKLGDRGAIYIGGWALYKAELKKNLAAGMSEAEAKKKALNKFERVTDETQQSGRLSQQSYWQSNPFLRMFTMFQSSQNQYLRKEINAVRGVLTGRMDKMQAAKTLFIFHVLLPCFFQLASDGFDWDKKAQLRAALLGSLNGIFILNSILEKGLDIALGADDSWQATRVGLRDILPPWSTFEDIAAFFVKFAEDDVELEDYVRAIKSFGELAGIPAKYPLDVIQNFGSYAEEGEYFKEVLLWLGWSPYALREKED